MTTKEQVRGMLDTGLNIWGGNVMPDLNDEAAVIGGNFGLTVAQAYATLYVGEQLERIADVLAGGFRVEHNDDTFGDKTAYIEPRVTR